MRCSNCQVIVKLLVVLCRRGCRRRPSSARWDQRQGLTAMELLFPPILLLTLAHAYKLPHATIPVAVDVAVAVAAAAVAVTVVVAVAAVDVAVAAVPVSTVVIAAMCVAPAATVDATFAAPVAVALVVVVVAPLRLSPPYMSIFLQGDGLRLASPEAVRRLLSVPPVHVC